MAELAALGASLQVLFGKVLDALCRYTGHTYRLLGGVDQDLEKLKITLERLQEMLKNDGAKVFRNEATRKWYHRVRCAVNDADAILEDGDEILEGTLDSDDDHKHRQNLTVHLKMLTLEDCEQLKLSSADFQHLTKLQELNLGRLPELRSLPELQHLLSLDSLYIYNCKNLKELPQWLQNLTSLQELDIQGCDHDLESRCAEDSGEYWPFIKHIPKVSVGDFLSIRRT